MMISEINFERSIFCSNHFFDGFIMALLLVAQIMAFLCLDLPIFVAIVFIQMILFTEVIFRMTGYVCLAQTVCKRE